MENSACPVTSLDHGEDHAVLGCLRENLEFDSQNLGDHVGYVCRDPIRGEYFRIGLREYEVIRLFDGNRTIEGIADATAETEYPTDVDSVKRIASWLIQHGLLESSPYNRPAEPGLRGVFLNALSKLVSFKVPLIDADPIARHLCKWLGWLFTGWGVVVWFAMLSAGVSVASIQWDQFSRDLRIVFDPSSWVLLGIAWCVVKIFHEAGHAVAASRQNVAVGQAGIFVLLFAPIAYVDVTEGWRLARPWSRIQIAVAGVYVELLLASMAVFVWALSPDGGLSNIAMNVAIAAGPTTLLVNANPLMRLDGYFALSDLTRIPNLAMHGSRQLVGWVEWLCLGRSRPPSLLVGWRRPFATIHAFMSIIYRAIWIFGLVLLVGTYFSGLGLVPAMVAVGLWIFVPFCRWIAKLFVAPDRSSAMRRFGETCLLCVGLCGLSMTFSSPLGQSVPVVVTHKDHEQLRARGSGFVDVIHVVSGQSVSENQVLLEIANPELELECFTNRLEIEASRIRHRQLLRQGKRGLAQGEKEKLASLIANQQELEGQLARQRMIAPKAGVVLTANLERLQGTHVESGDLLLEIGRPHQKELVASIAQSHVENYRSAAELFSDSKVRIRGGRWLCVRLVPSDPRGSTSLPHPAMAANVGGSVPVEPNEESGDMQMTEPRFEALIPIPEAVAEGLQSGQRGTLMLRDQRSVFRLLCDRISRVVEDAAETLRNAS